MNATIRTHNVLRRLGLLAMIVATAPLSCIAHGFPLTNFTLIRVTTTDGTPLSANAVLIARLATTGENRVRSFDPFLLSPPDGDGQVIVPVTRDCGNCLSVFDGKLSVFIAMDGESETLDIENQDGAITSGATYTIEVIETDSSPPLLPLPRVVLGTNPPQIEIGAYIDGMLVCSNLDATPVAWILAAGDGAYLERLSVGTLPFGFVEAGANDAGVKSDFPTSVCSIPQAHGPNGHTLRFGSAGGLQRFEIIYCTDDSGRTQECESQ